MSGPHRHDGPLSPLVEGYREWLLTRGYSPSAVPRSLAALGHLGRWMQREELASDQLTAEHATSFLAEHRRSHGRLPSSSVWPLVEYLRAFDVLAEEPRHPETPTERLVSEYADWLVHKRALAPSTIRSSLQVARRFIERRAAEQKDMAGITGADLNAFLIQECARVSAASAACYATRLRALLRYLAARGMADPQLADAVPRVARWRETGIPQFPQRPDIDRLIAACDPACATGARNIAVLLLLARLGLRAVEVSRLQLHDLDWRAGEITVDGKAHRRDRLPLPTDVGEALVSHFRHRDRWPGQHVFLTVHAPIRPLEASGVRTIVRNACRRAGVEHIPTHQLRHALASDLLRDGASMIDIGQVLRHNQLQSTAIYAKVDLGRLRLAATPWPGPTQ